MSALPANIDKSAFRRGEYVCYDAAGNAWRVRRSGRREWLATGKASQPWKRAEIRAETLGSLAEFLSQFNPVA